MLSTKLNSSGTFAIHNCFYVRIVDKNLLIRRLNIVAAHVVSETSVQISGGSYEQLDLFTDYAAIEAAREQEQAELERERKMQQAMLAIKKKFGKNAILKAFIIAPF